MQLKTPDKSVTDKRVARRFLIRVPGLFLLISLISLISCSPEIPVISSEDSRSLQRWLDSERQTPADLLPVEISEGRSPVLIQDEILRADTVDLMRALLPSLYDQGIREIGVFFLDSSKQSDIDGFIAEGKEETRAVKLLLSADAALGYREYCDYMDYVRDFNGRLSPGENPMRLRALGETGKTSAKLIDEALGHFESPGEAENIQVMPIFLWIKAEDTALLPEHPDTPESSETPDPTPAPVVIAHHGPDKDRLRWNGLIEQVNSERDIRDRTFAFYTDMPPFSSFPEFESIFSAEIYIVTPFEYRAVTPIPDFITEGSASAALEFFPEISIEKPLGWLALRMNRITRRAAKKYNAGIENIREQYEN